MCVFEWAQGEPVVYTDWKWLEKDYVIGLGVWIGRLHNLTARFCNERKLTHSLDAPLWSHLHDGVLAKASVDQADLEAQRDEAQFGLIHGDINPSNYFWISDANIPCVFDWDQMQFGWFAYDLSQPIWGVVLIAGAGNPVDQKPVPNANAESFTEWLLQGYCAQGRSVDRAQLQRMLALRRELYLRFCSDALKELADDHPMTAFCRFIVNWLTGDSQQN